MGALIWLWLEANIALVMYLQILQLGRARADVDDDAALTSMSAPHSLDSHMVAFRPSGSTSSAITPYIPIKQGPDLLWDPSL